MERNKKLLGYSVLVLTLLFVISTLFINSYKHYNIWEDHRNYLINKEQQIQPWMSLGMISRTYNIDSQILLLELNLSEKINLHMTIEQVCKKQKQNCTLVIEGLNKLR